MNKKLSLLLALALLGPAARTAGAQDIPSVREVKVSCATAAYEHKQPMTMTGNAYLPKDLKLNDIFATREGGDDEDWFGVSCKDHWVLMGCTDEKMKVTILPDNYAPPGILPLGIDMYGLTTEKSIRDNGCFVRVKFFAPGAKIYATCCSLAVPE